MFFIYLLATLVFSFVVLYYQKIRFPKSKIFLFFLIFLFTQVISFIFSIDKYISFYGYYSRFNGGILSLFFFLLLFLSLSKLWDKKDILRMLRLSVYTSALVSIIGILSRFNFDLVCFALVGDIANDCWSAQFDPSQRIFSTLGQPNWLAAYLAVNIIFSYYFYLKENNKVFFLLLFINTAALAFTRSVSGMISTISAAVLFAGIAYYKDKTLAKRIFFTLAIILSILLLVVDKTFLIQKISQLAKLAPTTPPTVKPTNQSITDQTSNPTQITDSGKIRLIVWKGAIELWKRYPLLGTGPETFGISYYFTRPKEHNLTSEWNFIYNKAHNEFLNYLANTGIVGFAGFFLFLTSIIILSIKKTRVSKDLIYPALLAAIIGIQISNFFGFSTSTISLYFFTLPLIITNYNKKNKETQSNFKKLKYSIAIPTIAFLLSALYFLYLFYKADLYFAKGKRQYQENQVIESVENLNKAVATLYNPEYANYLSLSLRDLYLVSKQLDKDTQSSSLKQLSIYFNEKTLQDSPYNIRYMKNSGKIAVAFYQADKDAQILDWGIQKLQKAHNLAPTDVGSFYTLLLLQFIKYQENETELEKILKQQIPQLIDLKPDYPLSYTLASKIIFLTQGKKQAIEYLQEVNKTLNSNEIKKELELLKEL